VLSRRVGERLLIGDDIVVTVIEVRSDGVRLGIKAPREVRVHRAEVIEAVRLTNVEAVEAGDATEAALRRLVPSGPPDTRPSGPPDTRPSGPPDTRLSGPPDTRLSGPPDTRLSDEAAGEPAHKDAKGAGSRQAPKPGPAATRARARR
jgi:carbon storage regulator